MAPLQKRALLSLIVGLALTIALVVVLAIEGDVTAFDNNISMRVVTYAALVGVPLTYLILVNLTLRKTTQVDERDRLIVEGSSRAQWLAVIFTLAAWTIILTLHYEDRGQVPVDFLNFIFVSTMITGTLAQSLGILLGYRRMNRHG